ncbi:MAG: OmpA family protein [Gammaproteobacteria bacterium]|nr:OmpA family protein [Gammaproteobacteria bacterium]
MTEPVTPEQGESIQTGSGLVTTGTLFSVLSTDNKTCGEQDDWVITYMDLITLLLTVFIVLLAFADHNSEAGFNEVSRSIAMASQGKVETISEPEQPHADPDQDEFEHLATMLQRQFDASGLTDSVDIQQTLGKLHIQLSDKILFASGDASFTPQAMATLEPLLAMLLDSQYDISVEGHTDNIPINTPRFPSNWELSAARASNVVRHLIVQGIAPERLRAVGYADSRPVDGNIDAESRSKNRRVTLILSREVEPD